MKRVLWALVLLVLVPGPAWADEPMVSTKRPSITGETRYTATLIAHPGVWKPNADRLRFQWFRDGVPVPGATERHYRLGLDDVGARMKVQVSARSSGHIWTARGSRWTTPIGYRVPVRRTVTYRIETRGRITASLREFARQTAETLADPRGWRNAGVAFRRVSGPADFSLVLAEASWLPRFSSGCSVEWSCRVGRYVIINQMRWLGASPAWLGAGHSVRSYRDLVVNHETGHWLGHGHAGCAGPGRLAPVMMQQSKGVGGCRFNPWPLASELWTR